MADYLDKQIVGGAGEEAVNLEVPNAFPTYEVKKGAKVVLDPLTGSYLPHSMALPRISVTDDSAFSTSVYRYINNSRGDVSILTDDGVFFGYQVLASDGTSTRKALTQYRRLPDGDLTYEGYVYFYSASSVSALYAHITQPKKVAPNVWVSIRYQQTDKYYRLIFFTYDPVTQEMTVSAPNTAGSNTTGSDMAGESSVISNNDGTFFVFLPKSKSSSAAVIADHWDIETEARLSASPLPFGYHASNAIPRTYATNIYGVAAPTSDGTFIFNDYGTLKLRSWTGGAFNEVGTVGEVDQYNKAPLVRIKEDVFVSFSSYYGGVKWRVVRYDPQAKRLDTVVNQVETSSALEFMSSIGPSFNASCVDDHFILYSSTMVIKAQFDPNTFELDLNTLQVIERAGDPLSSLFAIESSGLCHGFRYTIKSGLSYSPAQNAFASFTLFTAGNLLPNKAPIPIGSARSTSLEVLDLWVTVPTTKGEGLEVGSVYGSKYAITDEYAVSLRPAESIYRRTFTGNVLEGNAGRLLGAPSFRSDNARTRGGEVESVADVPLNIEFGVRAIASVEQTSVQVQAAFEGFVADERIKTLTLSSSEDYIYIAKGDAVLNASLFALTFSENQRDGEIFTLIEAK